ncbi:MAG: NAD-dependent DNA ligase LigA [Deltaproteobacteria bacterium]|nr:NAD-dependent DNA ligase LigA [Deltaproteobacteria bacterium]
MRRAKYETWPVAQLEKAIRRHNHRYFVEHAPEITDAEFDRIVAILRRRAPQSPVMQEIGSDVASTGAATVMHDVPMLSLDKCYELGDLVDWAEKFSGGIVASPKIDGVALALRYDVSGALVLAATRGTGTRGENVTANVRHIAQIPQSIGRHGRRTPVEIRGEVYLPLSVFRARFAEDFANPRNLAAGAIKQKNAHKTADYQLNFFAYDLLGVACETEDAKRHWLQQAGLIVVPWQVGDATRVKKICEAYFARRDDYDFETDGVVLKVNRIAEQEQVGATPHHPRYAIAYKFHGDSATTTLRAIEWSVSRTGTITPVGVVDPVVLSGATVSRMSLHNVGLARRLGVGVGATVVVMRRGGVIPHLETVVHAGSASLRAPRRCPACGGRVVRVEDFLYCAHPDGCLTARVGMLQHFLSVIECDGFGPKILEQIVTAGLARDPADLFTVTVEALLPLERMGQTLAAKLVARLEESRSMTLERFLQALGVPMLARQTARILAGFGSLDQVLRVTREELADIHGIGARSADALVTGICERRPLIDKLRRYVKIRPVGTTAHQTDSPLAGKTFLFTGTLAAMQRKAAMALVEKQGGRIASGVHATLDYLVIGSEGHPGSKLSKARTYVAEGAELRILTEKEFLAMVRS